MKRKQKVIVVLPAYNAKETLEKTIKKIPQGYYDEFFLIDDSSYDNTYQKARELGIESYRNEINLGYGGNLKRCLLKALDKGADIIVEMHPDGEYGPEAIIPALEKIKDGADFVLGNRFSTKYSALSTGMPFWKYIPSRILSLFHKFILGVSVSDLHQGFRVYTRKLLNDINFSTNSNDYLFSFEVISQAVFFKKKITEVPVACNYTGNKRGASFKNSVLYSLGTFKVVLILVLSRLGIKNRMFFGKKIDSRCTICDEKHYLEEKYMVEDFITHKAFVIYLCHFCENGFTYPVPKNLDSYYPTSYFGGNNFIDSIRKHIYLFFQRRRVKSIASYTKKGAILDVGAGEGYIGELLKKRGFTYQGIDASFADLKNKDIIKTDFLSFESKIKYNVITYWESFEHVPSPKKYLKKTKSLLKDKGFIIIEVPRFDSMESILFKNKWYHLSPPRHLSHFTNKGIKKILELEGYKVVREMPIFALEYSIWGFIQSFFNIFESQDKASSIMIERNNIKSKILYVFPILFLLPISFLFQIITYVLRLSPITLLVATKNGSYEN